MLFAFLQQSVPCRSSRCRAEAAPGKRGGGGRGAVARSPPARPLARRSHPTRGCSGGLRGLARGRACACRPGRTEAPRSRACAPCSPSRYDHPSIVPCIADAASGAAASCRPRSPFQDQEKGRERRAPLSGARTAPCAHCSGRSPGTEPCPAFLICISHDPGQSVNVSREADGFCLGGKGVAGGACAVVVDWNQGFYCCSLFPPPSLLFSLPLSFFPP